MIAQQPSSTLLTGDESEIFSTRPGPGEGVTLVADDAVYPDCVLQGESIYNALDRMLIPASDILRVIILPAESFVDESNGSPELFVAWRGE